MKSAKYSIRLPESLKKDLQELAKEENRSLASLLVDILYRALKERRVAK